MTKRYRPPIEGRVDRDERPVRVGDTVKVTCNTHATEGYPCRGVVTKWMGYGVAEIAAMPRPRRRGEHFEPYFEPGLYDVSSSNIERVIKRGPGARGGGRDRVRTRRRR